MTKSPKKAHRAKLNIPISALEHILLIDSIHGKCRCSIHSIFFAWTIPLSSVDHAESHYIASISEIVAAIKDEYTAANLH